MLMLSSVLVDEITSLHIRNAAGLALKNALTARVCLVLSFTVSRFTFFADRRKAYGKGISQLAGLHFRTIQSRRSNKMR